MDQAGEPSRDLDGPLCVQTARGSRVAVSSGHDMASAEAIRVLRDGGNIVDAVIAGAAVLSVVLPYASGIGGDMYLLYYDSKSGRMHGLNGTGAAPSGAVPARFADGMPQSGIRSASVPGVVAAWEDALDRFGTRTLRDLLQPAIGYAREGFPVHRGLIENVLEKQSLISRNEEAARLFLPGGRVPELGHTVVQSDLARSLARIAEGGAREFYAGALAENMLRRIEALGGLFSSEDLARHRTLWQEPIHARIYGHEIFTMPPNSLGLGLLLQLLAFQAADAGAADSSDVSFWQRTIAAWRRAHHASDGLIGDPRDSVALAEALLEKTASDPSSIALPGPGPGALPASGDTSNLVIIDSGGSAVSLVQSVSGPFASGIVLEGTGVLLNNRMRGFNTREGSVNCVAPGRRPAHTLVPAMIARDGEVVMSIGTPGAAGQTITLAQVLVRMLARGQSVGEAIAAPRWSIAPSGRIIVERTAPPSVISELRRSEPDLELLDVRNVRFGSVKAVWRDGSSVRAVADYRRVAAARAW